MPLLLKALAEVSPQCSSYTKYTPKPDFFSRMPSKLCRFYPSFLSAGKRALLQKSSQGLFGWWGSLDEASVDKLFHRLFCRVFDSSHLHSVSNNYMPLKLWASTFSLMLREFLWQRNSQGRPCLALWHNIGSTSGSDADPCGLEMAGWSNRWVFWWIEQMMSLRTYSILYEPLMMCRKHWSLESLYVQRWTLLSWRPMAIWKDYRCPLRLDCQSQNW